MLEQEKGYKILFASCGTKELPPDVDPSSVFTTVETKRILLEKMQRMSIEEKEDYRMIIDFELFFNGKIS
jgi:hypothetical protein